MCTRVHVESIVLFHCFELSFYGQIGIRRLDGDWLATQIFWKMLGGALASTYIFSGHKFSQIIGMRLEWPKPGRMYSFALSGWGANIPRCNNYQICHHHGHWVVLIKVFADMMCPSALLPTLEIFPLNFVLGEMDQHWSRKTAPHLAMLFEI